MGLHDRLFTQYPRVLERGAQKLPLQEGDRVMDRGFAGAPQSTHLSDGYGHINRISEDGRTAEVVWDNQAVTKTSIRTLMRVSRSWVPTPHDSAYELPRFGPKDAVILGNGDRGMVLAEVTGPTGFKSFRVQITDSMDQASVGRRVFATGSGMIKAAGLGPETVASVYRPDGEIIGVVGCELAVDQHAQQVGLQKHSSLPSDSGMLFPYNPPQNVSFHMGAVQFPIDVVFVDGSGHIAGIEHNCQPGVDASWTSPGRVAAVLEVTGGWCADRGVYPGDIVSLRTTKTAQETFDPMRSDDHTRAPTDIRPDAPDRFKGHDTPDEMLATQPLDGQHFEQQIGYDPAVDFGDDVTITRPH